jgi:hypothetical protein
MGGTNLVSEEEAEITADAEKIAGNAALGLQRPSRSRWALARHPVHRRIHSRGNCTIAWLADRRHRSSPSIPKSPNSLVLGSGLLAMRKPAPW